MTKEDQPSADTNPRPVDGRAGFASPRNWLGAAGGAVAGAAGNYVSISAEIKKELQEKHGRSLTKETHHGSVSRGFMVGSDVDESTAAAKLEDGLLRLTLPKCQGSPSRTLKIE